MCHIDTTVDNIQPELVGTPTTDKQNIDIQNVPCDRIQIIPAVTSLPGISLSNKSRLRILSGADYLYIVRRKRRYHPYKRPRGYFRRPKTSRQTGPDNKQGSTKTKKTGSNNKPSNCITSDVKALGPLMNIQQSLMNFGLSYLTESDYRQMREWESESVTSLTVPSSNTQGNSYTDYQNPFSGIAITYAVVPTFNKIKTDDLQTQHETTPSETPPTGEASLSVDTQNDGEKRQDIKSKDDNGIINEKEFKSDNKNKNRETDGTDHDESKADKTNGINDKQDTVGDERYLKTDPDDGELDLNDETLHHKNAEVCALLGFKYEGPQAFYEKLLATFPYKPEKPPSLDNALVLADKGLSTVIGKTKDVADNRSQSNKDVKKPNADPVNVTFKGAPKKANHTKDEDVTPDRKMFDKFTKKPSLDHLASITKREPQKRNNDKRLVTPCESNMQRQGASSTKPHSKPDNDNIDCTKFFLKRKNIDPAPNKAIINISIATWTAFGMYLKRTLTTIQIEQDAKKPMRTHVEVSSKTVEQKKKNDTRSKTTNKPYKESVLATYIYVNRVNSTNTKNAVLKQTNNQPALVPRRALFLNQNKMSRFEEGAEKIRTCGGREKDVDKTTKPQSTRQIISLHPDKGSRCEDKASDANKGYKKGQVELPSHHAENTGTCYNDLRVVLKNNNKELAPVPRQILFPKPSKPSRLEEMAEKITTNSKGVAEKVNHDTTSVTINKPGNQLQRDSNPGVNHTDTTKTTLNTEPAPDKPKIKVEGRISSATSKTENSETYRNQTDKESKISKLDHLEVPPKREEQNANTDIRSVTTNKHEKQNRENTTKHNKNDVTGHNGIIDSTVVLTRKQLQPASDKTIVSNGERLPDNIGKTEKLEHRRDHKEKITKKPKIDVLKLTPKGEAQKENEENRYVTFNEIDKKQQIESTIIHDENASNDNTRFTNATTKRKNPESAPDKTIVNIGKTLSTVICKAKDKAFDSNQVDKDVKKSDDLEVTTKKEPNKTNNDIISTSTHEKQRQNELTTRYDTAPNIDHTDSTKSVLERKNTEPAPEPRRKLLLNSAKKIRFEEGTGTVKTSDNSKKHSSTKPQSSGQIICLNPAKNSGFVNKTDGVRQDQTREQGESSGAKHDENPRINLNNSTRIVLKRKNEEPAPVPHRMLVHDPSKKSRFEEGTEKAKRSDEDAEKNLTTKLKSARQIICLNPSKGSGVCKDKARDVKMGEKKGQSDSSTECDANSGPNNTNSTRNVLKRKKEEPVPVPHRLIELNPSKKSRFEEDAQKEKKGGRSNDDDENNSSIKSQSSGKTICLNPSKRAGVCGDKSDCIKTGDRTPVDMGNFIPPYRRKSIAESAEPCSSTGMVTSKQSNMINYWKYITPGRNDTVTNKANQKTNTKDTETISRSRKIICLNPHKQVSSIRSTNRNDEESSDTFSQNTLKVPVKSRLGFQEHVPVKRRLGYKEREPSNDSYSRQYNGTETDCPSVPVRGRRGWRKRPAETTSPPDMTARCSLNTTEHQKKGKIILNRRQINFN